MARTDVKNYAAALARTADDPVETGNELSKLSVVVGRVTLVKQFLLNASMEPPAPRQKVLDRVLRDFSPRMKKFMDILLSDNLLAQLPAIAQAYRQILKKEYGVAEVEIITATPLSSEARQEILEKVLPASRPRIVEEVVDPEVLGGLRVIVDDQEHDHTLGGALESLKQQLTNV